MGFFSTSKRTKSPAARAAQIERKIARKKKKLADKARLEKARKDWQRLSGK